MKIKKYIKPNRLEEGDTVALITLSWGGAAEVPNRYEIGKKQIEESLKVKVINTPNALKPSNWIYNNPEARLKDLLWAFQNPKVKAIFTIIGGDDSIRLLDFIDDGVLNIIKKNPKIFVGFSDTTTINYLCLKSGLLSFYGPTVLFGLAENGGIHDYTLEYLKKVLFSSETIGEIKNNKKGWTLDRVPWTEENSSKIRKMQPYLPLKFLQGKKIADGRLIGGCMDVMEILKCTSLWPNEEVWKGSILFLEISEEKPSINLVTYWLRNYGAQGILKNIKGILFGIPGGDINFDDKDYESKLKKHLDSLNDYDGAIKKVMKEYGLEDLPVVTNVQFGHICPMMTIPFGATIKIDPINKKLEILESGVR